MSDDSNSFSFKSPKHKLIKFFKESRDSWKERAANYHKKMRSLEIKVRDLQNSRDIWKEKFLKDRVDIARRGHPPPSSRKVARRTTATLGPESW